MRIGASGGGGGGSCSVMAEFCATSVVGASTTFVADTFMPFLRPKTSVLLPFTMKVWPFGTLNCWFVPSSRVRITDEGAFTCHTFPVTVWPVVMVLGVVVVVIVF